MTQFNVATETQFLREGLGQLKDYLLSDEIFWNVGGSQQLTLGNLLLAKEFLAGTSQLPAAEAKELTALKEEWRSAWEKKAEREFASRLRQWANFLSEFGEQRGPSTAYYATEARLRALLELLLAESSHGVAPGLRSQLAATDSQLKALTESGDFVWGDESKAAFPKGKYWFLWVSVK